MKTLIYLFEHLGDADVITEKAAWRIFFLAILWGAAILAAMMIILKVQGL